MKYSICFSYRDREEHLGIVIPKIHDYLMHQAIEHEFIIAEQNDDKKFRRANLLNEAVKAASGDIVVLHDIDFIPVEGDYWDGESDVYCPVRRVEFKKNDLTDRPLESIPKTYKDAHIAVQDEYYGGVITFVKDAFYKINGFHTGFVGWGHEDDNLGRRIKIYNLSFKRSSKGLFYVLDHKDNFPTNDDDDFNKNKDMAKPINIQKYLKDGISYQTSNIEVITPKHPLVDKWILCTDFDTTYIEEV